MVKFTPHRRAKILDARSGHIDPQIGQQILLEDGRMLWVKPESGRAWKTGDTIELPAAIEKGFQNRISNTTQNDIGKASPGLRYIVGRLSQEQIRARFRI